MSIHFFGFGTNRDHAMMAHMVGRQDISGKPGRITGYELGIILAKNFRTEVPKTSPITLSPRDLIVNSFGPDFEMYVSRPHPDGVIYGTIWDITPDEMKLVEEWEMVEYGAQENVTTTATTEGGEIVEVITQSFMRPPVPKFERVVTGSDYEPYIAPKAAMLKRADEVRLQYLELMKKIGK